MFGAGVIVNRCSFTNNQANRASGYGVVPTGGALRAGEGAGLRMDSCNFTTNTALMGGAVCVTDASMSATNTVFRRNNVTSDGVGGAVAIELSPGKDIPVINAPNTLGNLVFQCVSCSFVKNYGALRGGPISEWVFRV